MIGIKTKLFFHSHKQKYIKFKEGINPKFRCNLIYKVKDQILRLELKSKCTSYCKLGTLDGK